jgi:hypothetical protein
MPHIYRNYIDPLSFPNKTVGNSGCRVVWRIPKGNNVIPESIKVVNLSFSTTTPGAKFNGSYGVYEPLSYVLLRTANGQEISECRNPAELARILNTTETTNDYVDGVYSLESGNAVSMSIDPNTQLQTFRRAMTNSLKINQGYYKIELSRLLPVIKSMPDVWNAGFEVILEFGNTFAYCANCSIASIVLEYDELQDYKHSEKVSKFMFNEWLPEKLYWTAGGFGFTNNQLRFLTFYGRTINRFLMYKVDATDNLPVLLQGAGTQPVSENLYLNGQQFYPLLSAVDGYRQRKCAEFLGGMVFPYNHLINTNGGITLADEPSIYDVLVGETGNFGINNSDAVLNVSCHKLNGLRVEELVLQISADNALNNTYPAMYIYVWGETMKIGQVNENGDFECQFV